MSLKTFQLIKIVIVLASIFYNAYSSAVSLSTYRIYLDRQERSYDFIVSNRDEVEQKCKLALTHHNIDGNGVPQMVLNGVLPDNSAVELIRYSPRNFTIAPFERQTVRFSMRSKQQLPAKEYRSYLEINCQKVIPQTVAKDNENTTFAGIGLSPQLVHQVPIIVRPKKLKTQVDIIDITAGLDKKSISFTVSRLGERSIFADIELIDKSNDKRIDLVKNVAVYPENDKKILTVQTQGIALDKLQIKLTEDKRTGGELVLIKDVISEQ